jgi:ABC-type antimicrobial peptide transport system permease subunit
VVCGFLTFNVISSIVSEQKRQIGIMKTIGASQGDTFLMYGGIAFAYGLIGVIPGLLFGIPAGNALSHAFAPQLNTSLEGLLQILACWDCYRYWARYPGSHLSINFTCLLWHTGQNFERLGRHWD